jgi:hypothetical protein
VTQEQTSGRFENKKANTENKTVDDDGTDEKKKEEKVAGNI